LIGICFGFRIVFRILDFEFVSDFEIRISDFTSLMTYDEAIQFWFGRVNYEQKAPQVHDLNLDRMRTLLERLGNPHERLRIIHIAGSKGKGSTAAMLAAVLEAAGYRTGLFTSPHLVHVEERIQVARQPISRKELAALMAEIQSAAVGASLPMVTRPVLETQGPASLERSLTFFEIATALGFLHFVRRRVDVAVIEVGLGGRFDSTNVCMPLAAIITSISLDHTQVLGNTPELIAVEKAGIIKRGRPTISGVRGDGPRRVIADVCRARGSPLRALERDFHYEYEPAVIDAAHEEDAVAHVHTWRQTRRGVHLGLIGEHQAHNAAVAVAAIELLGELGLPVNEAALRRGLAEVQWPARLEVVGRRPIAVLDCAHNVASAHALVQALRTSFPLAAGGRRLLVFAGSRDKDLAGMLRVLAPLFDRILLTRFRNSTRTTSPQDLAQLLPAGHTATTVEDAVEAWRQAQGEAVEGDLICAAGSVFLAGELRAALQR
jgi:dihydrofolate synthase/folylpolyglutamate synthase